MIKTNEEKMLDILEEICVNVEHCKNEIERVADALESINRPVYGRHNIY